MLCNASDVGAFEDHDNLEHLLGPADGVSTDTLDVAQELIKQHEPSKVTLYRWPAPDSSRPSRQ